MRGHARRLSKSYVRSLIESKSAPAKSVATARWLLSVRWLILAFAQQKTTAQADIRQRIEHVYFVPLADIMAIGLNIYPMYAAVPHG